MGNILFVKMTVTNGDRNYINITKYKVSKVTDKRVYYYSILDEDTNEDDILYVEKDRFNNCIVKSISEKAITSSIWCKEEDLEDAKNKVGFDLKKFVLKFLNNVDKSYKHPRIRSMIRI